MRKLLVSVAIATATIATGVPAAAQAQVGWFRGGPTRAQVNDLIRDLNRAESRIAIAQRQRRDGISPREAMSLRREAQQIRLRLNFAARNGINAREFANLRARVNQLEARVRYERHDRDNRRF